jgi:hypothetical protein
VEDIEIAERKPPALMWKCRGKSCEFKTLEKDPPFPCPDCGSYAYTATTGTPRDPIPFKLELFRAKPKTKEEMNALAVKLFKGKVVRR